MATYAERVAAAVDDLDWQRFRRSLKGLDTLSKLNTLHEYWSEEHYEQTVAATDCDVCIRVDNYLKALARGGQLYPGASLEQAIAWDWCLRIKS